MNNTMRQKVKDTDLNQLSIQALLSLETKGFKLGIEENEPILYFYYQVARMNPFQRLLYTSAWENGFSPIPVFDFEDLFSVQFTGKKFIHIHWINGVLNDVISETEAKLNIDEYLSKIDKLKALGFTVIWTIHNIVSHSCVLLNEEYKLREQLAEKVDILHILTKNTVEFTRDLYTLPSEKIIYHPHPSYVDSYPNFISKSEARYDLGFSENDIVFLIFGSIQKYKGVEYFLEIFTEYKNKNPLKHNVKALIAGLPSDKELVNNIKDKYDSREDIILDLARIENSEVQYYINSSDFVVCPYGRSLNSGVGMLALSFNRPIIAPKMGGFIELISNNKNFGKLYSDEEKNTLYDLIEDSVEEYKSVDNLQIKNDFSIYDSSEVSDQFFKNLRLLSNDEGNKNV
jgi:glycosyltransferase involved in cell wall biosynthesis